MPWFERFASIKSLPWVSDVVKVDDRYGHVMEALKRINPDYFGNGGTRKKANTSKTEISFCEEAGITTLWNLGENSLQDSNISIIQSRITKEMIKLVNQYEKNRTWEK